MFKFAHSLSIVVSFMFACVHTLCGVEHSTFQEYKSISNQEASIFEIYAKVFKNLSAKKTSITSKSLDDVKLKYSIIEIPSVEIEIFYTNLDYCKKDNNLPTNIVESQKKVSNLSYRKAYPIRAPSIASYC